MLVDPHVISLEMLGARLAFSADGNAGPCGTGNAPGKRATRPEGSAIKWWLLRCVL